MQSVFLELLKETYATALNRNKCNGFIGAVYVWQLFCSTYVNKEIRLKFIYIGLEIVFANALKITYCVLDSAQCLIVST